MGMRGATRGPLPITAYCAHPCRSQVKPDPPLDASILIGSGQRILWPALLMWKLARSALAPRVGHRGSDTLETLRYGPKPANDSLQPPTLTGHHCQRIALQAQVLRITYLGTEDNHAKGGRLSCWSGCCLLFSPVLGPVACQHFPPGGKKRGAEGQFQEIAWDERQETQCKHPLASYKAGQPW